MPISHNIKGLTFADYEYETDLAIAATYTPPAKTLWQIFAESALNAVIINVEWYDSINAAWALRIDDVNEKFLMYQSASQRLRVINDDAAAARAVYCGGITWS